MKNEIDEACERYKLAFSSFRDAEMIMEKAKQAFEVIKEKYYPTPGRKNRVSEIMGETNAKQN